MPPKLRPNGHVWADGEKGPGPQTMKEVCCCEVAVEAVAGGPGEVRLGPAFCFSHVP